MIEQTALPLIEPTSKKVKDRPRFKTSGEVLAALRAKFPADAYALLKEVGNSTGFKCNRHADAVVMSLWPSRGLEIIGIEVKVSRSDWMAELRQPQKADAVAKYCDRWYLAVGDSEIVQPGELPKGWGLFVPAKDSKLFCKVEATLAVPEPQIDRSFIASLLRRAQEQLTPEAALREEFNRGKKEAAEDYKRSREYDKSSAEQRLTELQDKVNVFCKASGVDIANAWRGEKIGEAVRAVMHGAYMREKERLKDLHGRVLQCADFIANELKTSELLVDGIRTHESGI